MVRDFFYIKPSTLFPFVTLRETRFQRRLVWVTLNAARDAVYQQLRDDTIHEHPHIDEFNERYDPMNHCERPIFGFHPEDEPPRNVFASITRACSPANTNWRHEVSMYTKAAAKRKQTYNIEQVRNDQIAAYLGYAAGTFPSAKRLPDVADIEWDIFDKLHEFDHSPAEYTDDDEYRMMQHYRSFLERERTNALQTVMQTSDTSLMFGVYMKDLRDIIAVLNLLD